MKGEYKGISYEVEYEGGFIFIPDVTIYKYRLSCDMHNLREKILDDDQSFEDYVKKEIDEIVNMSKVIL